MMDSSSQLPLKDVRILDLTQAWSGPYASRLLADMGAEVIKVESWQRPDFTRMQARSVPLHKANLKPPFDSNGVHNTLSRNKFGITLDISRPQGKDVFKRIVKISDVVMENFSARVMTKLGLGYSELSAVNPAIIMISMPGFGLYGTDCGRLAYGTTVEAMCGLAEITGYPDRTAARSGVNYADPSAGINAAVAVLIALNYRADTGEGQQIDMAQSEAVSCMLGEAFMDFTMNGRVQPRMGNRDRWLVQGVYPCKGTDKWVAISLAGDEDWRRLVELMGKPGWTQDTRFSDQIQRRRNQDELDRHIGDWTKEQSHYEAMHILQDAGIAAGAVANAEEVMRDPHLKQRGFFTEIRYAEDEIYPDCGMVWRLSDTQGGVRMPSPALGEHSHHVYKGLLKMSDEEIADLVAERVI